jgi:hypothetical protein
MIHPMLIYTISKRQITYDLPAQVNRLHFDPVTINLGSVGNSECTGIRPPTSQHNL